MGACPCHRHSADAEHHRAAQDQPQDPRSLLGDLLRLGCPVLEHHLPALSQSCCASLRTRPDRTSHKAAQRTVGLHPASRLGLPEVSCAHKAPRTTVHSQPGHPTIKVTRVTHKRPAAGPMVGRGMLEDVVTSAGRACRSLSTVRTQAGLHTDLLSFYLHPWRHQSEGSPLPRVRLGPDSTPPRPVLTSVC